MDAATERVLGFFEQVSRIPRRSRDEGRIADWLTGWAQERGLEVRRDAVGNLLIAAPGRGGLEGAPTVVIQGHLDMVCEKTPDSPHDFSKDPIQLVRDGEWLRADRTTLGADNGIAIAMSLAVLDDPDAVHPPLELLFTIDEETGLTGATELDPGLVTGKVLLNVDSEDEGVLTVGCAGGQQTDIVLGFALDAVPADAAPLRLEVSGLSGGHSGVDIHLGRANANAVLGRVLHLLVSEHGARIVAVHGGTAHNAIPRDAHAEILVPAAGVAAAQAAVAELGEAVCRENAVTDPRLAVALVPGSRVEAPLSADSGSRLASLLVTLPHGVARMSPDIVGLVRTSNNLATVRTDRVSGQIAIVTSQRSSVMSELGALSRRVELVARLAGASVETDGGYPAWEPNMASPLLARCKALYERDFGKAPVVEIIHAGLECGVIGAKVPGMDMISFGPTIKDPHSPNERLFLPSVEPVYRYLRAILASFGPAEA